MIPQIESLITEGNATFAPYWGWHDDHREADGTDAYLPALQQVRSEFYALTAILDRRVRCLQLGAGHCDAPHAVWRCLFEHVVTIDWRQSMVDSNVYPGMDTGSAAALALAQEFGPYDLVFIDADHTFDGVARDYARYAPLAAHQGVIAFHDALPRAAYSEVEVHRFVAALGTTVIGDEVGVAWLRR